MIYHAIQTLHHSSRIAHIVIVLSPDDDEWSKYNRDWIAFSDKLSILNCGGKTRADSVLNGLKAIPASISVNAHDWILVHDAARPCLKLSRLEKLMDTLTDDKVGGLLAIPVADTLKQGNAQYRSIGSTSRKNLWQAQTPQMFRCALLIKALTTTNNTVITDDASAIEALGFQPKLVNGDSSNLKVTYPEDLILAELILKQGEIQ